MQSNNIWNPSSTKDKKKPTDSHLDLPKKLACSTYYTRRRCYRYITTFNKLYVDSEQVACFL